MIFICLYDLYLCNISKSRLKFRKKEISLFCPPNTVAFTTSFFVHILPSPTSSKLFFVDFSHPLTTCSLGSSSRFPEIRSKLPCHTSVMYGLLKYILKKPLVMVRTSIIMHRYFKWK